MDDSKIDLARQLYVEQGAALPDIAVRLDMLLGPLRAHAIANDWDKTRTVYVENKRKAAEDGNLLAQHEFRLRESALKVAEVRKRFELAQQDENYNMHEARKWRDTVEAEQRFHQITVEQIKAERLVFGVKLNAPSVQTDAGAANGIQYVVKIRREDQKAEAHG